MSQAGSALDSQLGLTQSELMVFRQAAEVAAQRRATGSAMADRGRGTSRHSQPSSRDASAASSRSGAARPVVMSTNNIQAISNALDSIMQGMQTRLDQLFNAAEIYQERQYSGIIESQQRQENEARKNRQIMQEIASLEQRNTDIKGVCKKIKDLRKRIDAAGGRLDQIMVARGISQIAAR